MKILFLSYNGLLEPILPSQAIPYLKGLAKLGYEFILLTYEKKCDLNRVGHADVRKLKDDLKKEGIEWRYLRYHKNPPFFSTLFDLFVGLLQTFFIIKSSRVKIVHVRGITPGVIIIALSKILKFKIIFDMRGLLAEEYVGGGLWKEGGIQFRMVKRAEKRMLSIADAVTVLTQKHLDLNRSLDYLSKRKIPMDVIPCCVNMRKFFYDKEDERSLRKELGLERAFILMYPGKIGTFYFMDEMLTFYRYASGVIPEIVFFIITHDEPSHFLVCAKSLGVRTDKIVIKEKIPFEEMPRYVRIADAGIFFINPYKKIGSSPIKMGEFLASGIPVIINPGVGDTEELVRENRVGVVVSGFTDENYRKAIDELISLKKEGDALKDRCVRTAEKVLSHDVAIARYAKIYEALGAGMK